MSNLTKAVALAAIGSGAMLASGAGMAAGTPLPGLFTINTASNITDVIAGTLTDCPVGSTCQDLPGTSPGIVMRSVTNGAITYIQTIIAEDGANGLFANEQDAQQGIQGAQNATNIAQKMLMDDHAGFTANHTFVGDGFAALVPGGTGNDPWYVLNQQIVSQGTTMKVRVQGPITGAGGNVNDQNNNRKVYIDQVGGAGIGEFRYRWANTPATAQNVDLYGGLSSGIANTGTTNTNVGALYIHQAVTADLNKVDPGNDNDFGLMKYFGDTAALSATSNMTTLGTSDPDAIVEMDLLTGNSLTLAADAADGYGTWGTGSNAEAVFGAINDLTDFDTTSFMP